jgi:hypothetical protein
MDRTGGADTETRKGASEDMQYLTLIGKCTEVDDASYTNQRTGEVVHRTKITLEIPTMRERVGCELGVDALPDPGTQERWELDESWLVVEASGLRALGFERTSVRAGEKPVGALVIFQGTAVREVTAEERKQLQAARKQQKVAAKQRRVERQAQRQAERAAREAEAAAEVKRSA